MHVDVIKLYLEIGIVISIDLIIDENLSVLNNNFEERETNSQLLFRVEIICKHNRCVSIRLILHSCTNSLSIIRNWIVVRIYYKTILIYVDLTSTGFGNTI